MKNANLYAGTEQVKDKKVAGQHNPGEVGMNPPITTPPVSTASASSYNPINNQVWGEGGGGYDAHMEQAQQEAAKRENDPTYGQAYTNEGMQQAANNAGIPGDMFYYSQYASPDTYTGRPAKEHDAGADEAKLSDVEYAYVQYAKQMYNAAQTDEEKAYWHNEAEKVRARYDYSGGADGSMYITNGEMGLNTNPGGNGMQSGNLPSGSGQSGAGGESDLKGLLEAWQQATMQQSDGKIDYAVAKAVADLERALQDAQPQFKEQAETVAREERQALDNSALYAEMRGDKGGIGQEQYNSIQNTAAQNHLAVQQAQTKLATDTQRQIADLRAQGEFEKADAALQITQQYLQQLIGLEQWAKEYNLSVEQFQESIRQWEAEYNMAMQQFQTGVNQWQAEFDAAQNQWQQQFDYNKQSDLANVGWALLESGIPLSEEQMSAMGIDPGQASQILWQAQLKAVGTPKTEWQKMSPDQIYQALYAAGYTDKQPESIENFLRANGVSNPGSYASAYVNEQYGALNKTNNTVGTWGDGYGTSKKFYENGQPVASEWEIIKSNVRTMLTNGDFAGVTQYIDDLDKAGRWTEQQWNEIRTMLDNSGYFN